MVSEHDRPADPERIAAVRTEALDSREAEGMAALLTLLHGSTSGTAQFPWGSLHPVLIVGSCGMSKLTSATPPSGWSRSSPVDLGQLAVAVSAYAGPITDELAVQEIESQVTPRRRLLWDDRGPRNPHRGEMDMAKKATAAKMRQRAMSDEHKAALAE